MNEENTMDAETRAEAVRAVAAVLKTSTASDGGASTTALEGLATVIVDVVAEVETGSDAVVAVLTHWDVDDVDREVFDS